MAILDSRSREINPRFFTPLERRIVSDLFESLFSDDPYTEPDRHQSKAPEKKLWLRIVEDALELCLGQACYASPPDLSDALAWVDEDGDQVGSFRFACAILRLDPDYVRRLLSEAQKRRAAA